MDTKISIEFIAPGKLNELKEDELAEKTPWKYSDIEDSTLLLDVDNWTISCDTNNTCDSITNWLVDETTCSMEIKSDDVNPCFKELSYSFAVSMIGQICDSNRLMSYLQSLEQLFEAKKKQKENPTDDNNRSDESIDKKK